MMVLPVDMAAGEGMDIDVSVANGLSEQDEEAPITTPGTSFLDKHSQQTAIMV